MKPFNHTGEFKISVGVGPRCETVGCMKPIDHDGECTISLRIGPRCKKTFECCYHVGHDGECIRIARHTVYAMRWGIHDPPAPTGNFFFKQDLVPKHGSLVADHTHGDV
jgi:hypothetical protein